MPLARGQGLRVIYPLTFDLIANKDWNALRSVSTSLEGNDERQVGSTTRASTIEAVQDF